MACDRAALVEAVYRLDVDDRAWLAGILTVLLAGLRGESGFAWARGAGAGTDAAKHVAIGCSASLGRRVAAELASLDRRGRDALVARPPVGVLGRGLRGPCGRIRAAASAAGWEAGAYALASDEAGPVCALLLLRRPAATRQRGQRAQLAWLAHHLGASFGVRRRLGTAGGRTGANPGPARIRAAGRIVLRAAAVAAVRRGGRRRPGLAAAVWEGISTGRLAVVDQFDTGDRRVVVAQRQLAAASWATMSVRERQAAALAARGWTNKAIAFELEVAASTVGTHLASASAKLGVGSRIELVQLLACRPPTVAP